MRWVCILRGEVDMGHVVDVDVVNRATCWSLRGMVFLGDTRHG